MENLFLFLFASAGASLIVTLSSIFEPFRKLFHLSSPQRETQIESGAEKGTKKERILLFFKELFHCPMCFGFWMGIAMYLMIYKDLNLLAMFAHACASSASSIIAYRLIR